MFQKIENYLILKNSENYEEHIAKIVELEKESRKIKLQLIDENKNIYYKRNRELEVLIPQNKELFFFKSSVIYYDLLEKIVTIEYPNEIDKIRRREHIRYDINVALDVVLDSHIIPSISFDMSLGGLAFIINNNIELDDIIPIKIKTEELMENEFRVKIVSKKDFRYKGKNYLMYSGEFFELEQASFDNLLFFFNKNNNEEININIDTITAI